MRAEEILLLWEMAAADYNQCRIVFLDGRLNDLFYASLSYRYGEVYAGHFLEPGCIRTDLRIC